jgi:D-beta-D-heptose 7-phosphate kinase/D-beta-D-heptose 1-phosphate adenosyltransferase
VDKGDKMKSRLLVIGDMMLDKYICGSVTRISPEAPVLITKEEKIEYFLGGASNVANNLRGLNHQCFLYGIIGNDIHGVIFKKLLSKNLNSKFNKVIVSNKTITITKTRIIGNGQQLLRIDSEQFINSTLLYKTLWHDLAKGNLSSLNIVIISDYGKGTINKNIIKTISLLKQHLGPDILILVDPYVKNMEYYSGVTGIKPNHIQAAEIYGSPVETDDEVMAAGRFMINKFNLKFVLITRGKKGMSLCTRETTHHISSNVKQLYDVSGAGDTVIATFAYALSSGFPLIKAAKLANKAAGIVVGERGTTSITKEKLKL